MEKRTHEEIYNRYVKHTERPEEGWRGPCWARVPEPLADAVEDAMNYFGSTVNVRRVDGSHYFDDIGETDIILLKSDGYWANGY